jgi:hypothetical protein
MYERYFFTVVSNAFMIHLARNSVVGRAARYRLDGSNPGRTKIFLTHPERPWAHLACYKRGNGSLSWGKAVQCGVEIPLQSNAQVKERVGLYLYSASGPSWFVTG